MTFVSATRLSEAEFLTQTLLGCSLQRMERLGNYALRLFHQNRLPLGTCYNEAITYAQQDDILVFLHDDVRLDDWHIAARLNDALSRFDVVGIAGNRTCLDGQELWCIPFSRVVSSPQAADEESQNLLSGSVSYGTGPDAEIKWFGPAPAEVMLLDGVFLAARAETLLRNELRFDPSLGFHFYDLDFCRSASARGLRIGTWPIALTHASDGSTESIAWRESRELYLKKWNKL